MYGGLARVIFLNSELKKSENFEAAVAKTVELKNFHQHY